MSITSNLLEAFRVSTVRAGAGAGDHNAFDTIVAVQAAQSCLDVVAHPNQTQFRPGSVNHVGDNLLINCFQNDKLL